MMHDQYNPSIKCSVDECSFHCGKENYCSLNEIKVGSCKSTVNSSEATECASFRKDNGMR